MDVLGAGLTSPSFSTSTTTTAAILASVILTTTAAQVPSITVVPTYTAHTVTVPNSVIITTQQVVKSTALKLLQLLAVSPLIMHFYSSVPEFHHLKMGIMLAMG